MDTNQTLTEIVTKQIMDEIKDGIYKDEKRLPPEKEIALRLGVSRTVVRDALAVLEREGFINRKHGIGTIINHHVLQIANRMDLEQEFCEEVRASGFSPSRKLLEVQKIPADEAIAGRLKIELNAPVYAVSRLIYADERPAIYCIDYFSETLIVRNDYALEDFEASIFDFLTKFCHTDIHMDITEVRAFAADLPVAKNLDIPFATPVLYMGELGYTFFGEPVLFSKEYYNDGIFHHMLLRKKI